MRSLVGDTLPVIVESKRGPSGPVATSDVFVPVELLRAPESGGIVPARILGVDGSRLIGVPAAGATGGGRNTAGATG